MRGAIIASGGIGDSLLMMIVARHFKEDGYDMTIFGDSAEMVAPLFEGYTFTSDLSLETLEERLGLFDRVIIENDHSERSYFLFDLRERKPELPLTFFLPTKSRRQKKGDFIFDYNQPIATNLAHICSHLFQTKSPSKENGLIRPKGKIYRRFSRRIVIHPTSTSRLRNWNPNLYLRLAHLLIDRGFSVSFSVSSKEHAEWLFVKKEGIELPYFGTLSETAAYLYESGFFIGNDSGIGHLASNLGIPTVTISGKRAWVKLWRPDWHSGKIVTPPFPLPNFKGINWHFREKYWSLFVPVFYVLRTFNQLYQEVTEKCEQQ